MIIYIHTNAEFITIIKILPRISFLFAKNNNLKLFPFKKKPFKKTNLQYQ